MSWIAWTILGAAFVLSAAIVCLVVVVVVLRAIIKRLRAKKATPTTLAPASAKPLPVPTAEPVEAIAVASPIPSVTPTDHIEDRIEDLKRQQSVLAREQRAAQRELDLAKLWQDAEKKRLDELKIPS